MIEVLQKWVAYCANDDISFRPGRENAFSRAAFSIMITNYIRTCYEEVQKKVMWSRANGTVWIENINGILESFAGFVQLLSDNAETTSRVWH